MKTGRMRSRQKYTTEKKQYDDGKNRGGANKGGEGKEREHMQ